MLLPFIISTLFGDASEATGDEHAPTEAAARHAVGPSIMLWVVAVACIVNLGVYWALCKRGGQLRDALAAAAAAEQVHDAAAAGAAGDESGLAGSGGAGGKGWNTADLASSSSAGGASGAVFTGASSSSSSGSGSSKLGAGYGSSSVGSYVADESAWDSAPADAAAALGDSAAAPAYTTEPDGSLAFKHSGASAPASAPSASHAAAPLYAPTAYPAEYEAAAVQSPQGDLASTGGSGAEFAGIGAGSPAVRTPLAAEPAQGGYSGYMGWGGGVEAVAAAEADPLPSGEWGSSSSAAPAHASSGPRAAGGHGEFAGQGW
jgi:hypothetical protein